YEAVRAGLPRVAAGLPRRVGPGGAGELPFRRDDDSSLVTWPPVAKKARTPKPPRSSGNAPRAVQAPQRRTGPSRTARSTVSPTNFLMRYFWPLAAGVVALVILGIVLGIVLTRGTPGFAMQGAVSWKDLPGLQTKKPPWPANFSSLTTRLGSVNLTGLPQEALAFHIHQHLDLYVDGKH